MSLLQRTGLQGRRGVYPRLAGPALILLAAAIAVTPQLIRGPSCGHDFDFHLVSWFDAQNSWRQGNLYPRWAASANFGAGEPRFVFYPPLTWMMGAALGFVLPWPLVPVALTFLLLAATGLATRALALQALQDGAATLAGCAALFSGYALFCAYERSAFGELAGGLWMPLILLFALRDRNASGRAIPRALDGSAVPLALAVAGAWLSNAPVGVMGCYLLAAVALAAALLSKSWAPVLRAALAAVLGMGLAAIYLVPAAWEQRWVAIRQATDYASEKIENSWLFARHADPSLALHDVELHKVSVLAAAMIALAVAGLLIAWRRKALPKRLHWWIPLALMPAAILFLQLPISLPVWNLLPKLRFLQFPWRWLVALEAPMAIFAATAVWPRRQDFRWRAVTISVCAAVFLASTAFSGLAFFQVCDDEDAVLPMLGQFHSGAGFAGTDEYAPPAADNALVASGLPAACLVDDPDVPLGVTPAGSAEGAIPVWDASQASCAATFSADPTPGKSLSEPLRIHAVLPHAGFLILRRRSYPDWRVTVNGLPAAALPPREDGLLAVPVPQGAVVLAVDWTVSADEITGRRLSALAVLLLTVLFALERQRTASRFRADASLRKLV